MNISRALARRGAEKRARRWLDSPLLAIWVLASATANVEAQRHPPEIRGVFPLGGRRGGVTRVIVSGVSFRDAIDVVFDRPGVTAKIIAPAMDKLPAPTPDNDGVTEATLELTTARDAMPGMYTFRIVTRRGLSNVGRWLVSRDAPDREISKLVSEKEQTHSVSLPISVNGRIIDAGDQDTFSFALEAGKTFVAEVNAAPLGSPLDSLLTLRDARGQEVASNDDWNGPDSRLIYKAAKSGQYALTISSSVGMGGPDYAYRMSFGYLPLLTSVFPVNAVFKIATTASPNALAATSITANGVNLPTSIAPHLFYVPPVIEAGERMEPEFGRAAVETPDGITNSLPIGVMPPPTNVIPILVSEKEPNDTRQTAMPVSPPVAISGRFQRPSGKTGPDDDFYRFHVQAGQRLRFTVQCQAIGTSGDPMLTLFDSEGTQLDENDDANSRDAALDRTFANAGDYFVRVREVAGRTGAEFVYRLVIQAPPPPGFSLAAESRNRVVARGDRLALEVAVNRNEWDGPVTLSATNLPSGVTATTSVVPAGFGRGVLVFAADGAAPLGAFPLAIVGQAEVNGQKRTIALSQASDWVWRGGGRQSVPVPSQFVSLAVGEPDSVTISTLVAPLTLARGGSTKLKVHVTRAPGMDKPVVLRATGLPEGVEAADVTLAPDKNEMEIEIKAKQEARLGTFSIAVNGLVAHNQFVMLEHASLALALTVAAAPPK